MSRAMELASFRIRAERARARLFPPSNGRAFFPPLPIAALLRRSWRWADSNGGAWNVSALHSRFCKAKGQRHFKTMLAFGASRRACRPKAVCTGQLAGNHIRRANRGTCRAMAVTLQPSYFPSGVPAPYGRGMGSRAARGRRKAGCPWDNPVCLWQTELFKFYLKSSPSPSGHNRRRRLATGSRQPKRGFGTAVPKTTIEVADHCPLREPEALSPNDGLYRPTARESHQTRELWHPSCHGGKTPAKLHVPLRPCAPQARSPGCRGTTPAKRGSWRKGGRRSGRA